MCGALHVTSKPIQQNKYLNKTQYGKGSLFFVVDKITTTCYENSRHISLVRLVYLKCSIADCNHIHRATDGYKKKRPPFFLNTSQQFKIFPLISGSPALYRTCVDLHTFLCHLSISTATFPDVHINRLQIFHHF
jgi:hypothetical protein